MKKTYVKPELSFESFELSASIASGCGAKTYHSDVTCSPFPGEKVFTSFEGGCETFPDDKGLCYQMATDADRLFAS